MNFKTIIISAFLLCGMHLTEDRPDLATRHDVAAEKYFELARQFREVGKVGKNGGDGTLIAPQWVVTAAHVAEGMQRRSGGDFSVWFKNDELEVKVVQIILHPDFRPMGPHDIALLKLERAVEGIEPAGLYRRSDELNTDIVLVGHGDTKVGTGGAWQSDRKKRGATNRIDGVNEHHIQFTFNAPDSGKATDLEGTAGPGDSGGPAFIVHRNKHFVAGISSLGRPGHNGPGTYGAKESYVRASRYAPWLDGLMKNPPREKLVNFNAAPDRGTRVQRGPGGPMPEGMSRIDAWGLIVREANETVIMAGKIDPMVPEAINKIGIRPPAKVISVNGIEIKSIASLEQELAKIKSGEDYKVLFEYQGKSLTAALKKQ